MMRQKSTTVRGTGNTSYLSYSEHPREYAGRPEKGEPARARPSLSIIVCLQSLVYGFEFRVSDREFPLGQSIEKRYNRIIGCVTGNRQDAR